jgi:hypothetical protein
MLYHLLLASEYPSSPQESRRNYRSSYIFLKFEVVYYVTNKLTLDKTSFRRHSKNCILKISVFLDFFHRPVFERLENTTFRKLDLFSSSGEGGRHLLSWILERANLSPKTQ